MRAREQGRLPDFLIIGAPKAGSSALHAALTQHPGLHLSAVKEPKYFLCGDAPPPLYTGPGDAHSRREWVWRRDQYEQLFSGAAPGQLCGESTPFYLHSPDAHVRIAAAVPDVRLIAVLRDPVDRAYSNWMHLWADGLEPEADFVAACDAEEARVAGGWAPFWRYRDLGRYGQQLQALYGCVDRDRVHLVRYRDLVDSPGRTVDEVCRFLGVDPGRVSAIPRDNTKPYVSDGPRRRVLSRVVRAGAGAGAFFRPTLWRRTSRPVLRALQNNPAAVRPDLDLDQRRAALAPLLDDIELLEELLSTDFSDWRGGSSRGAFVSRAG